MKKNEEDNDIGLKEKRITADDCSHGGQFPSLEFEAGTH
jgi:hypothetical protein